jgi:hypothetical protein
VNSVHESSLHGKLGVTNAGKLTENMQHSMLWWQARKVILDGPKNLKHSSKYSIITVTFQESCREMKFNFTPKYSFEAAAVFQHSWFATNNYCSNDASLLFKSDWVQGIKWKRVQLNLYGDSVLRPSDDSIMDSQNVVFCRQQRSLNKGRYQPPNGVTGQWQVTATRCEADLQQH